MRLCLVSQCTGKTLRTLSQADAGVKQKLLGGRPPKRESRAWQCTGPHLPRPRPSHTPVDKVNIVHGETGSAKDVFAN